LVGKVISEIPLKEDFLYPLSDLIFGHGASMRSWPRMRKLFLMSGCQSSTRAQLMFEVGERIRERYGASPRRAHSVASTMRAGAVSTQ
jgi:hypothetical protein